MDLSKAFDILNHDLQLSNFYEKLPHKHTSNVFFSERVCMCLVMSIHREDSLDHLDCQGTDQR